MMLDMLSITSFIASWEKSPHTKWQSVEVQKNVYPPWASYPWFCTKQLLLLLPVVSPLVVGLGPGRGIGISWAVSTAALPLLAEPPGAKARIAASCRCWTGDWPCGSETIFRSQQCWQWNGGGCHPQPSWAASFNSGSPGAQYLDRR